MNSVRKHSLKRKITSAIGLVATYASVAFFFVKLEGPLETLEVLTMIVLGISVLTYSVQSGQRDRKSNSLTVNNKS